MCRNPSCSRQGFNKGSWSATEDTILANYVTVHGEGRWTKVPKRAGLSRCPRSCRLRWLNYLRPDIKRGNISHEEEDLIIRLHNLLGNRWSLIAGRLPGRTDNEIKNYWNTVLKKKKKKMVMMMMTTAEEDGSRRSQEEIIGFPEFASSGSCWVDEASAAVQGGDARKQSDASFFAPTGEEGDLDMLLLGGGWLMGSENEGDFFLEEEVMARAAVDSPASFDYDASVGEGACDEDWLGANLGSLAAICHTETEYVSLWSDIV